MATKTGLELRVETARQAKRWTQDDLAGATGIGIASVRRVELGTFDPRLSTARRMATELNVSLDWLVGGESEKGTDRWRQAHQGRRPTRGRGDAG